MNKQILIFFVALLTATTHAQTSESNTSEQAKQSKLAIKGFDPVAYFESGKAIEGKKEITATFNNVVYYFSSESNKALFLKNPSYYEPQFGGFCAFGMSNGYEAPIQPEAFTIVDNKLYLNYNLKVKEMWLKEQSERIEKANVNWEKMKKEKK